MATSNNSVAAQPIVALVKGFTFIKEYVFLVVLHNKKNEKIFFGKGDISSISNLMHLKDRNIEFEFKGVKEVNGVSYNQWNMICIAF